MNNQIEQLKIGDEIGRVNFANSRDENDSVVFFPVAEITLRDGEIAYRYMYPDGELSRSAVKHSELKHHLVKVQEVIKPVSEEMICLSDRKKEFVEAMERGFDFDLQVFADWEKDTFVVVNHDSGNEYRIGIKSNDGQVFASCSCPDFKYRRRICKHVASVLSDTFFGLLTQGIS